MHNLLIPPRCHSTAVPFPVHAVPLEAHSCAQSTAWRYSMGFALLIQCCFVGACQRERAQQPRMDPRENAIDDTSALYRQGSVTWLALGAESPIAAPSDRQAAAAPEVGSDDSKLEPAAKSVGWLGISDLAPEAHSRAEAATRCTQQRQQLCTAPQLRHYYATVFGTSASGTAASAARGIRADGIASGGTCQDALFAGPAGAEWTQEAGETCELATVRARTRCCIARGLALNPISAPEEPFRGTATAEASIINAVVRLLDARDVEGPAPKHEGHVYASADVARVAIGLKPGEEAPWTLLPTPFWWEPTKNAGARLVVTGTTAEGHGWIAVLRSDAKRLVLERYLLEAGAGRAPVVAKLDDDLSSLRWGSCWKCSGRRGILAYRQESNEAKLALR